MATDSDPRQVIVENGQICLRSAGRSAKLNSGITRRARLPSCLTTPREYRLTTAASARSRSRPEGGVVSATRPRCGDDFPDDRSTRSSLACGADTIIAGHHADLPGRRPFLHRRAKPLGGGWGAKLESASVTVCINDGIPQQSDRACRGEIPILVEKYELRWTAQAPVAAWRSGRGARRR